jgi:DNA-binding CsgD family transcriptional regulator/uncharacterized membrane protein
MFKKLAKCHKKEIISRKLINYLIVCIFLDIILCGASIFVAGYALRLMNGKNFMMYYTVITVVILLAMIFELVFTAYLTAKEMSAGKSSSEEKPASSSEDLFTEFIKCTQTLTPTERQIFNSYLSGKPGKEVSEQLGITMNTLKVHNNHIYKKLNVSSKEELSLYFDLIRKSGMLSKIEDRTSVC